MHTWEIRDGKCIHKFTHIILDDALSLDFPLSLHLRRETASADNATDLGTTLQ